MAIKTIEINRFDLGISDFERDLANGYVRYAEDVVIGDQFSVKQNVNIVLSSVNSTSNIQVLLDVNGSAYALGQSTSIYKGTTLMQSVGSTVTTTGKPFFQYYQGKVYFDGGSNNKIYYYNVSSDTWVAFSSLSGTNKMYDGCIWQGYGYGHYGKYVYKINLITGVTSQGPEIPSDQTIVDLIPYGNYLVIICTSNSQASRAYFWDGVTTTTFADIVDIGWGNVTGADILDGTLYALIGFPNKKGFRLKRYNGAIFQTAITYSGKPFGYVVAESGKKVVPVSTLKAYTGYLYFLVYMIRPNTTTYDVVLFRYGKKDETRQNSLSIYKKFGIGAFDGVLSTTNNDFIIIESNNNDNLFDNYIHAIVNKNNLSETYLVYTDLSNGPVFTSQAGVVDTGIYTCGDASITKQLKGVSVHHTYLPSGGSVVLQYKKDEETSWTTILTSDTTNSVSKEAVNIESTGVNLPQFKEISFRAKLLGNAELNAIKFKYEELSNIV